MSGMASAQELPPEVRMMQMLAGKWVSRAIAVAAELGIADLLREGARSTAELASASGAHERSLYRLLRALASLGVFVETTPRHFGLTPLAECLITDSPRSLRHLAQFLSMPMTWDAWRELSHSVRTGESGMHRLGVRNAFDYLRDHPDEAAIFNRAMTNFSQQAAVAVNERYDFSTICRLVDVAGGHGRMLLSVLERNPRLKGVLFDLPEVVETAKAAIASSPAADRCETVSGSFFEAVPAGADAYMLKHIIHDWDEPEATTILRNIRRAMGADGRLLVIEMVIPPGNDPFFGKLLDLEMLAIPGGRERTEAEFSDLFAAGGFTLTEIIPTEAPVSILEGRPA